MFIGQASGGAEAGAQRGIRSADRSPRRARARLPEGTSSPVTLSWTASPTPPTWWPPRQPGAHSLQDAARKGFGASGEDKTSAAAKRLRARQIAAESDAVGDTEPFGQASYVILQGTVADQVSDQVRERSAASASNNVA